jgi:phosphatidylserine decarboxylase
VAAPAGLLTRDVQSISLFVWRFDNSASNTHGRRAIGRWPKREGLGFVSARHILWGQIVILLLCGYALAALISNFPYPSPVIKPLLPAKLRWPSNQVSRWVEDGVFDRDFARYFARDPDRTIPATATLVSPADGIVQNIETRDTITYLVVGLSFWDVHVVRTPVAATVKSVEWEGSYLEKLASPEKIREMHFLHGKEAPVQAIITLATARGDVRVRMITSYWASRLKVWVWPGKKIQKGERIGRILLGSTVIAEFPGKVDFDVTQGQHVQGGDTTLTTR